MLRKLAALGFGLLSFNLLFFPFRADYAQKLTVFSFGTVWFFLGTVLAQVFLFLLYYQSRPTHKQNMASGASALAMIASLLAMFRANPVDQLLLGGLAAGMTLISFYLFSLTHEEFGALSELFIMPLQLFVSWLNGSVEALTDLPNLGKNLPDPSKLTPKIKMSQETTSGLVRGVVLALPILLVLVLLLVSADPIFAHMLQGLFQFQVPIFPMWIAQRFIFSLIFLVMLIPVAWATTREKFQSPFQRESFKNMKIESLVLGGSVALLLAFFLLIQFHYLFTTVSETELHKFGVQTYSEYVKKGFGELLLVSVIVYAVAGMNMVVHRLVSEKNGKLLKTVNVILLAETLIFIFSIMRRVWLYQATHGLSRIRVYGMAFLVMMFIFTVILILRHYKKLQIEWYVLEILTAVVVIFGTVMLNTDQMIATQFKPTVNDEVDYVYIARLSADSEDGWQEAYAQAKSVLLSPALKDRKVFSNNEVREIAYSNDIVSSLIVERGYLQDRYNGGSISLLNVLTPEVKAYNFAEDSAYQKAKNTIFTAELDALKARADELEKIITDTNQQVPLDRSSQSPLVK